MPYEFSATSIALQAEDRQFVHSTEELRPSKHRRRRWLHRDRGTEPAAPGEQLATCDTVDGMQFPVAKTTERLRQESAAFGGSSLDAHPTPSMESTVTSP